MATKLTLRDFDEWLRYVFDRPVYEDEAWYWKEEHLFCSDATDLPQVPRDLVVRHLTRLFLGPDMLVERFSLAQVEQGLWYIADESCSDHMKAVLDSAVPFPDRKRCIEATYELNERLFAVSCEDVCSHLGTPDNPLNGVCYMWWDLLPLGIEYDFPDDFNERMDRVKDGEPLPEAPTDPASLARHQGVHTTMLATMERILTLPSIACREGALHGLGHFREHYPREVERIVDAFLVQEATLPKELIAYARAARDGRVL